MLTWESYVNESHLWLTSIPLIHLLPDSCGPLRQTEKCAKAVRFGGEKQDMGERNKNRKVLSSRREARYLIDPGVTDTILHVIVEQYCPETLDEFVPGVWGIKIYCVSDLRVAKELII